MRKNNFIKLGVTMLIFLIMALIKPNSHYVNVFNGFNNDMICTDKLSIMYTDTNYISTYVIYDVENETLKEVFKRKNQHYSDFIIDEKDNVLYYSNLINKKYDIFQVDLVSNKETALFKDISQDGVSFDLYNNTMIFRCLSRDKTRYVLGKYSLINKKVEVFDTIDNDSDLFTFYWEKNNNLIYTIERSLINIENTNFPNYPIHNIYKYDINRENRELIYASNKFISSLSVSKDNNRILFNSELIENEKPITKISLLDLKSNNEEILLKENTNYNNIHIQVLSKPKFSTNEDGFYFLATTNGSSILEESDEFNPTKSKGIYFYNFKSKDIKTIYDIHNAVINDYKVESSKV